MRKIVHARASISLDLGICVFFFIYIYTVYICIYSTCTVYTIIPPIFRYISYLYCIILYLNTVLYRVFVFT